MKNIMKRAHEMAAKMEGDYRARMALALRQTWEEYKKGGSEMNEIKKEVRRIWEKANGLAEAPEVVKAKMEEALKIEDEEYWNKKWKAVSGAKYQNSEEEDKIIGITALIEMAIRVDGETGEELDDWFHDLCDAIDG